MATTLLLGDCLEELAKLADNSVSSIVTDPPYGLSFMGKKWDYDVPSVAIWKECLRVLKPGGHFLAFAGTRTQHRMAVNIEDAGFEIRDMIAWVYGSGFPKSRNLKGDWEGWGTALKPALEPITVARKPFKGTVAQNVSEHGTGGINIDGCRVKAADLPSACKGTGWAAQDKKNAESGYRPNAYYKEQDGVNYVPNENGRWPANLIHDGSEEVVELFPEAKGQQGAITGKEPSNKTNFVYGTYLERSASVPRGDSGNAARFFYCAKTSKRERGEGNNHPTVKPIALMSYLCRLVTPLGGVILDPFMGSGSTGIAAIKEGFNFIGIERELEYMAIAQRRIEEAERLCD